MLCHVIKTIKLEFVGSQLFSKGVCPNGFRVRVRARLDLFSFSVSFFTVFDLSSLLSLVFSTL